MARRGTSSGGLAPPKGGGRLRRPACRRRGDGEWPGGHPLVDRPAETRPLAGPVKGRFRGDSRVPWRLPDTARRGRFRGSSRPPRGAVRHCAGAGGDPRLAGVTNAGGDARRSSFFVPETGSTDVGVRFPTMGTAPVSRGPRLVGVPDRKRLVSTIHAWWAWRRRTRASTGPRSARRPPTLAQSERGSRLRLPTD